LYVETMTEMSGAWFMARSRTDRYGNAERNVSADILWTMLARRGPHQVLCA